MSYMLIKTISYLLDTSFTKFQLPCPSRTQCIFQSFLSFPTQFIVRIIRVSPYLFNITGTTSNNLIVQFYAGSFLKSVDQFKN